MGRQEGNQYTHKRASRHTTAVVLDCWTVGEEAPSLEALVHGVICVGFCFCSYYISGPHDLRGWEIYERRRVYVSIDER